MDLLVPGIGELIGGSQREERMDVLTAKMAEVGLDEADYWWCVNTLIRQLHAECMRMTAPRRGRLRVVRAPAALGRAAPRACPHGSLL